MRRFVITLSLICGLTSAALAQQAAKVERLSKSMDEIAPANLAWGGQAGKTLYIMTSGNLYIIRLKIPGVRP